jgi:PhzF family phenazine biosynthesis protein
VDRRFAQVDVFGTSPASGNSVAVVLDGDGIEEGRMQQLARWLNVAETTFVLPATRPEADYLIRIFTVADELPFAGHPTLGTCHAWLAAGHRPRQPGVIMQECGVGLVPVRRTGDGLGFSAPPLRRSGPLDERTRTAVLSALGVDDAQVRDTAWVDNGPGWLAVLLDDAGLVSQLSCAPVDQYVGIAGVRDDGDLEVRAFYPVRDAMVEDPVCGSLNAALARWLPALGAVHLPYTAHQGHALGHAGRVGISAENDEIWVSGTTRTLIQGTLHEACGAGELDEA